MIIRKEKIFLLSPIMLAKLTTQNKYIAAKHIRFLEKKIIPKLIKGNARIIINMPPRHGKSEYLSKFLPAWHLLNFPNKKIIISSYGADLSKQWSRQIKEIITNYGRMLNGIKLNPKHSAVGGFSINKFSGGLQAVGTSGSLTGKGADLIIIDDPVKNDQEANSLNQRNKLWEWYKATLYTRLEPRGNIILIMTRWHEDDICGRIIKTQAKKWDIIILPAIARDNCPLGRKPGEALWEERFSREKLDELRETLGEYWFESLYQQSPYPLSGGIFKVNKLKYFNFVDADVETENGITWRGDLRVFITVDLAASSKESADYTVLMAFAVDKDKNVYIFDVLRSHFDSLNHLEIITDFYQKWKPILVGIESVQYQSALIRAAAAKGIPVKALKPSKDKVSRALPMQAMLDNGMIYIPKYATWAEDFKSELIAFPNGKNDDQVDCFAYITEMIEPYSAAFEPTGRRGFRS